MDISNIKIFKNHIDSKVNFEYSICASNFSTKNIINIHIQDYGGIKMSDCEKILQKGVFDSIIVDTKKSVSENYIEWLKTSTYEEIKEKQNGGFSIGIPVEGAPIRWEGEFNQEKYKKLRNEIDSGQIRNLTSEEETHIVKKSASEVISKAWLDCIRSSAFGLLDYEEIGQDGSFSVLFRYSPNAPGDNPPTITGFVITNCTCVNPPKIGDKVPYGGITILFTRNKNQQGYFEEATYVLNTNKGTADGRIPAMGKPVSPKIRDIKFFHATNSSPAGWPSCEIEVPVGYKIIGGGGRLNWDKFGNLLTASYPLGLNKWLIRGKDHEKSDPVTCDVWAIGIYDPDDEFEVEINWADSDLRNHPQRAVSVRNGFQLVGGGARANWSVHGQLLTACYPIGRDTWSAQSKDHHFAEPSTITTYAIGIRPRNGANNIEIVINEVTIGPDQHPKGVCPAPNNCRLIGGGARANWKSSGIMLTASYPEGNSWVAKAKDHISPESGTLTIYALGIPNQYFA